MTTEPRPQPLQLAGEIAAQLDRPTAYFRTWIDSRFAGQRGFLCLGYIDGDPQIEDLRQKWYVYPWKPSAPPIRRLCSARLQPARWPPVSFPNARASIPMPFRAFGFGQMTCQPALLYRPGAQQRGQQAGVGTARPTAKRQRPQAAAKRVAAEAGADTCKFSNAVHMGRAGGYNRKRHGKFWSMSSSIAIASILLICC